MNCTLFHLSVQILCDPPFLATWDKNLFPSELRQHSQSILPKCSYIYSNSDLKTIFYWISKCGNIKSICEAEVVGILW